MTPASRRERLRALLAKSPADGMLVTSLPNIRYLTGFSGSNAVLFVSGSDRDDDVLGTDGRYAEQVGRESADLPVILDRSTLSAVSRQLAGHGVHHVLIEDTIRLVDQQSIEEHIRTAVSATGLVEQLRAIKDDDEMRLLEEAGAITAEAMQDIGREIGPGWTERAVARRLEQRFGELGADDRAFATIVGSGPHSAIPHHRPTDRPLALGDLVVIDAGAMVGGYHADMTRTFCVGRPFDWQRELHACVAEAAARGRAGAVPGADLRQLDSVAREVIAMAGWAEAFGHGLGHGVGLEIHEAPMIGPRAVGRLCASMAITIEPGVYLPGRGGVRIEDTIVVGSGAVLTEADRDLRSVGTSASRDE